MAALSREGARFFSKVKRPAAPGGCWLWTGALNSAGYPVFRRARGEDGRYPLVLAHRLAHFWRTGEWPDVVLHECDNPRCVRHTRGGTQAENVADMWAKGRARPGGRAARASALLAAVAEGSDRAARRADSIGRAGA